MGINVRLCAVVRHSDLAVNSSFVIGHSSLCGACFNRLGLLAIGLSLLVAMIGCKGTPIDVAKGRPSDSDIPDDVKSDFDQKPVTGWSDLRRKISARR